MLKKYSSLFILIWIIPQISGQWPTPLFLEAGTENVTFTSISGRTQLISAHEEIPVPFTIATINYRGTEPPVLNGFSLGSNNELGVEIKELADNQYDVVVTKFQDYEKISDFRYRFNIKVATEVEDGVIQLNILNLIDTYPSIEYNAPCTIKERQDPADVTNCIFDVFVDDGFSHNSGGVDWDNTITPELFGEENELFEFHYIQTTGKTMSYELKPKQILHYEIKPFYNFRSYFKNTADMSSSVLTIVELIDLPNMAPTWITPFAIETFDEKLFKSFQVKAIDGDTGIDEDIQFDIKFSDKDHDVYKDLILISKTGKNEATIQVPADGIDRDTLENEIYRFEIIAHKTFEGETWSTSSSALIVIDDINDNEPNITLLNEDGEEISEIWIYEEKFLTLPFDKIIVHDRDLEKNAMYSVSLGHDDETPFSVPFNIVPGNGYQRSEFFKIDVYQNENYLDFENETWRSFEIFMMAQETDTVDKKYTTKTIKINLINWNDELPIFEEGAEYSVSVPENITANEVLLQVKANDRDVGDKVIHSILGNLALLLDIDKDTGEISTNKDDTFDYEKQTQVILQVMAEDTLKTEYIGEVLHKVYAQVTIDITDINDETPEIKMPITPQIDENVPGGFIVTNKIKATDPDTTANLKFTINWDASYATKSGQSVEEIYYRDCFIINEIEDTINIVWGELKVNPAFVNPGIKDVNYEEFEVLYLTIEVEDLNQEIGEGTATAELTVRLIDLNDNPPQFIEQTLEIERNVLEEALTGTQIGTILAEDIDGPNFNVIKYSISPADDSIPDDWVEIDTKGIIRVNADKSIDCDEPPRDYLEYIVKLSDKDHTTEGNIKINIIDTNNKSPQISEFDPEISIKEKKTESGFPLATIMATDADRDQPYRNMQYLIDSTYKFGNYFEIDRTSGDLIVQLIGGVFFDYDLGEKNFDIPIEVYDSVTNVANRNTTQFRVNLIDINDHAPEFVGEYSPRISESSNINTELDELCAIDLDSDDNGLVSFILVSIEPFEGVTVAPASENLFQIKESNVNCMRLVVATSLQSYYGTWEVTITAKDHGDLDEDYQSQSTTQSFYVEVTPFNYNNPEIIYPTSNHDSIRLSDVQEINKILKDVNNDPLRPFEAKDEDGGVYGEVVFTVTGTPGQDNEDAGFFTFEKIDGKTSNLQLTKPIGSKNVFYITCTAYDGGDKASTARNLKITFVNIDGDPYFETSEDFVFFKEKAAGLDELYVIPKGIDPINEGLPEEDYEKIYYFLANTESAAYFNLDRETRVLQPIQELDRSEKEKHILKIILSRKEDSAPTNPSDDSILTLNILVTKVDAPAVDPIKPTIFYPFTNSLRLLAGQMANVNLLDVTGSNLRSFEAFGRNSDGSLSDITFIISNVPDEPEDADYFQITKVDKILSNLELAKTIDHSNPFNIQITARDSLGQESEPLNLKITFVNMNGIPYFENPVDFVFMHEKAPGLDELYVIPKGIDPINEGLEKEDDYEKIYYFLENSKSAAYFNLDRDTRVLQPIQELDRSEEDKHVLRVILSRNENGPTNPSDDSILTLNILVIDVDAPAVDPMKPTIFYPFTNSLRLLAGQMANVNLLDVTSSILRSFEAFGKNADYSLSEITFIISNVPTESEDADYFQITKVTKTTSNLELAKTIDQPNPFNIQITARDSGGQQSEPLNLKITFVEMSGTPYFEKLDDFVFIHENEIGFQDSYEIPRAIEPRNEGLEDDLQLEKLYYFIDETYNTADVSKFTLHSESGILTVREKLDRVAKETHDLRIIVSRNPSGPATNPPINSMLLLTIIVWDINDNPPIFERDIYAAGITTSDKTGKIIIPAVRANDLDLNETITYHILDDTFIAKGEGIDAVEVTAFRITSENNLGNIILNFIPKSAMVGHFEFQIEARDNDDLHNDRALVKIYIIADANRVTFVFVNSVDDIELNDNTQFMLNLFTDKFGFECNIDETEPATDDNGVPIDNLTNVIVHFIKDNEAIPAETIQELASDVVFITQLKTILAQRQLILQEVPTNTAISDDTNKAELLQTILIVLSVVLGILCAVLIIAFFIRTRNLRRQLKAMSTVDFGSTSSNLNRQQAPTTNVFSVEGSNPVLNNNNLKPQFDNISVHSDESDFAGIHNDPTFQHRKGSINPELIEEIRRKSVNPMVNG